MFYKVIDKVSSGSRRFIAAGTVFLFVSAINFSANGNYSVDCNLLLKMKIYFTPDFASWSPSIIPKYFYGQDTRTLTPLNCFGTNLAKMVSEVPEARAAARTYTAFRISTLVMVIGGFTFLLLL